MTDNDLETLNAEQTRARDMFRGWTPPAADPEFRARLRRQFVHGDFEVRPGRPGEELRRPPRRQGWLLGPTLRWAAAAAAVVVLAVGGYALNRGPRWTLIEASGVGVALIDGLPVPMNHVEDLRRRLRPGVRVRVPEGSRLVLASPGQIGLVATPGTDFTLPGSAGRWVGREVQGEVRSGILRLTTGPGFLGARLSLATPEAQVLVTGTTLAVICESEGTCVCVLEGAVEVGSREGTTVRVEHGKRRYVYNDTREPVTAPMRELESTELTKLRRRSDSMLGR